MPPGCLKATPRWSSQCFPQNRFHHRLPGRFSLLRSASYSSRQRVLNIYSCFYCYYSMPCCLKSKALFCCSDKIAAISPADYAYLPQLCCQVTNSYCNCADRPQVLTTSVLTGYAFLPQHFLYFLPLPQGQGSLGYTFGALCTVVDSFCSLYRVFLVSSSKISFHSSRP